MYVFPKNRLLQAMVTTRTIMITINAMNNHQSIKSYYRPKNYYITFILLPTLCWSTNTLPLTMLPIVLQ
ncbi:MAG TPA: hypothetical protein PLH80_12030 [Spirochaetota bacterium]|nr:hypothetical protein [Spirochaetota bacterium]HOM88562.1 hypothetical protein [Spirochaetota bacterium]HQG43678.1 hypothetical protein [Spirochaetota bacterium]HQI39281.1 hypothetical protein [Spirochaetota bacterium]HRV16247.1 hypothetical protein [Spirochaetota bacterium]